MRRSRCHDGSSRLCSRHTTRIRTSLSDAPKHLEEPDCPLLLVAVDSRGRPCSKPLPIPAPNPQASSKQQASRRSAQDSVPPVQLDRMAQRPQHRCDRWARRSCRTVMQVEKIAPLPPQPQPASVAPRRASHSNHVEVKHCQMQGGTLLKHRKPTGAPPNPCTPSCDTVLYTVVLLPAGTDM